MSAQLMKSKFVRHPSVRRLSVSQLSLNLMHGYLSKFGLAQTFFFNFEKKKMRGFCKNNFFALINMRPYGNENLKTLLLLQITAKSFQTCPEFSSEWSTQNYVWDF